MDGVTLSVSLISNMTYRFSESCDSVTPLVLRLCSKSGMSEWVYYPQPSFD